MTDAQQPAKPAQPNQIDRRFAEFIGSLSNGDPDVALAAMLVSFGRSLGHICLRLDAMDSALLDVAGGSVPEPAAWLQKLRSSPAVGAPGEFRPLILDASGRLYLHRYWEYEACLAAGLKARAKDHAGAVDRERLREQLARLYPAVPGEEIDWQRIAAFTALQKRLCVISGGPGAGKTRTVVVLLALILEQEPELRVVLSAPTGKAAARLQEAVKQTKEQLGISPQVKEKLPEEAATIHRLLGSIPNSAYFRHDAGNPLALDALVVDEASMVDLALMAKLVSALPESARLILLGDKDQLASVEAGAVLADICGASDRRPYSEAFRRELKGATGAVLPLPPGPETSAGLGDCIVELRKNYRFGNHSGIYRLSQAVNDGDSKRTREVLEHAAMGRSSDLALRPLPAPSRLKSELKRVVQERFGEFAEEKEPEAALRLLAQFRILSPLRAGPYGTENLNRIVAEILRETRSDVGREPFYAGRPIMVTRNDYNLKLFNGDMGVVLPDAGNERLLAWFPTADGKARGLLPLRLPEHETAYALTVHKSQGSEFERVLLILPDKDAPVLTRELVYTGLTRASKQVELWHVEPILRAAISRKTQRRSGLRDALWNSEGGDQRG